MLCAQMNKAEWIFGTYKLNVLSSLWLRLLCIIFYLSSYSNFFLADLLDYGFPYCIHLYIWSTHQVTVTQHICWFLKVSNSPVFISFILTLSRKAGWFPFSCHIWSAIPDFSISPHSTAFWCSSKLIFSGWRVSSLYTLQQLQRMEYIQSLIMLNSVGGWTRKKYFCKKKIILSSSNKMKRGKRKRRWKKRKRRWKKRKRRWKREGKEKEEAEKKKIK